MKRTLTAARLTFLLLGIVCLIITAYAEMEDCVTVAVCCPDDYPDNCGDNVTRLGSGSICRSL